MPSSRSNKLTFVETKFLTSTCDISQKTLLEPEDKRNCLADKFAPLQEVKKPDCQSKKLSGRHKSRLPKLTSGGLESKILSASQVLCLLGSLGFLDNGEGLLLVVEREVGFDLGGHLEVEFVGIEIIKKLILLSLSGIVVYF